MVDHVHVYPGGQAVVGRGHRGEGKNGQQPHAIGSSGLVIARALWCQDQRPATVQFLAGSRQAALPDARRGSGKRRPEGRVPRKLSTRPENN
jgi:hypothetical protein